MKKYQLTVCVASLRKLRGDSLHIVLSRPNGQEMPPMQPGQFVELTVGKADVLLNRPFSIFNADSEKLELIVKSLGRASKAMSGYTEGEDIDIIAPLGRGFTLPAKQCRVLLVGGGVGVAPLYYQARALNGIGIRPTLIYGERTVPDPWLCARLSEAADLQICTDDGSAGFHGLVTAHPSFTDMYGLVQVCGPMPMMKAVYRHQSGSTTPTQFSLENKMACGLGACLCCVEKTTTGNRCVCTDGPVFNIDELPW